MNLQDYQLSGQWPSLLLVIQPDVQPIEPIELIICLSYIISRVVPDIRLPDIIPSDISENRECGIRIRLSENLLSGVSEIGYPVSGYNINSGWISGSSFLKTRYPASKSVSGTTLINSIPIHIYF